MDESSPELPYSAAAAPAPSSQPGGRSFEQRASLTFKVLAAFAIVVIAIAVPSLRNSSAGGLATALTATASIGLVGLLILAAVGLDRRRPWAVAAARPILAVMLLTGFGGALVGLGQGRITFPLDALLATWSLFGSPDTWPSPRLGGRGMAVVAGYLAAAIAMYGALPALGPGGWLDVHEGDLIASAHADCGSASGGPPEAIDVTYAWSWQRTAPLPSGFDTIVVAWWGIDVNGQPLYILGDVPDTAGGIYPGAGGSATGDMVQAIEQGANGSWEWGIELAEQQLAPGEIRLRLLRAAPDPAPPSAGPVTIRVRYIHAGLWQAHPPSIVCEW